MNYGRFIWRDGDIEILPPEEAATPEETLNDIEPNI